MHLLIILKYCIHLKICIHIVEIMGSVPVLISYKKTLPLNFFLIK